MRQVRNAGRPCFLETAVAPLWEFVKIGATRVYSDLTTPLTSHVYTVCYGETTPSQRVHIHVLPPTTRVQTVISVLTSLSNQCLVTSYKP